MAIIGLLEKLGLTRKILAVLMYLPQKMGRFFFSIHTRQFALEEERIEQLTLQMIHNTRLLDQRKYIPHGPKCLEIEKFTDLI